MYSALNFGDEKSNVIHDIDAAPVEVTQQQFSITPLLILAGILLILK